ncbi:hypothetical protein [Gloeocapsopsis dulcis]|uniref:Uncharacterized protein n=1 Tax=Gloeocapsopsis dulcis AAB1 = 1H9 TaxID=1433147 RepID=A0A6N8FUI2_9CHRO|nr:hypothetical protein [Gloeocapsopsis dulcis]MUL36778.1 hypothetical protein [Gloeocapsopsis dulcis AAB1 = 1H9]WNN88615.1 hypothetical protein P0S91_20380 [Gloeocapsopsis dulcis]
MRSSTTSSHNSSSGSHYYSPSVPISVYKELAAQLQATEAKLHSLNAENYALAKQNQQLRQEIAKAIQSVIRLQQIVDSTAPYSRKSHHTNQHSSARSMHRRKKATKTPVIELTPKQSGTGFPRLHTEQEDGKYRRRVSPTASEVNGWGLAIAILLIIVSAFGAGYLIVGPLRSNR